MEIRVDRPSTAAFKISRVNKGQILAQGDTLAVEEPLEIQIRFGPVNARIKKNISITMRTPGSDFELAVGFLFTEGILTKRSHLQSVDFCGPTGNVVKVELSPKANFDLKRLERHFYTSSSCGVCGKSSIEALRTLNGPVTPSSTHPPLSVESQIIHDLPKKLREKQGIFETTGGLHACALFDAEGNLMLLREDVGRHNALDKLLGYSFLNKMLPLHQSILLVSGRGSFELVQKAAMAGLRFFAAVGAPSSLAVELATEIDMTLLGFVRDQRFNIYNGEKRVKP